MKVGIEFVIYLGGWDSLLCPVPSLMGWSALSNLRWYEIRVSDLFVALVG